MRTKNRMGFAPSPDSRGTPKSRHSVCPLGPRQPHPIGRRPPQRLPPAQPLPRETPRTQKLLSPHPLHNPSPLRHRLAHGPARRCPSARGNQKTWRTLPRRSDRMRRLTQPGQPGGRASSISGDQRRPNTQLKPRCRHRAPGILPQPRIPRLTTPRSRKNRRPRKSQVNLTSGLKMNGRNGLMNPNSKDPLTTPRGTTQRLLPQNLLSRECGEPHKNS